MRSMHHIGFLLIKGFFCSQCFALSILVLIIFIFFNSQLWGNKFYLLSSWCYRAHWEYSYFRTLCRLCEIKSRWLVSCNWSCHQTSLPTRGSAVWSVYAFLWEGVRVVEHFRWTASKFVLILLILEFPSSSSVSSLTLWTLRVAPGDSRPWWKTVITGWP